MKSLFSNGKFLAILAGIIAIVAVVTSIWLNPPSEIRAHALDQVRLSNLQHIELAIKIYYDSHRALPVDLNAVQSENSRLSQANWHDPVTKQPFEYEITSETSYRLCASFARNSDKAEYGYGGQLRDHGAGRACFQYRVGH